MSILANPVEMQQHLAHFKTRGSVFFPKVLAIPSGQRLPALMAYYGRQNMVKVLSTVITRATNTLNLRNGLSGVQAIELADVILEEATEDNLAMEDVLLFLQNLVRGKAGKLYDRLDMATFMEMFDEYREDRHEAIEHVRIEQQAQHKAYGDPQRSWSREEDPTRTAIKEYIRTHVNSKPDHQGGHTRTND